MELASDRRWCFDAPPDDVWAALAATSEYRTWWPWLTSFDAVGLVAGAQVAVHGAPAAAVLGAVRDRPRAGRAAAPADGSRDRATSPAGPASSIAACGERSEVRLVSTLAPTRRAMALLTAVAGPIARRSHDWVLDTGARQFAAHAVGR